MISARVDVGQQSGQVSHHGPNILECSGNPVRPGIGAAVAVRAMPMAKRSCVICIFATLVVVSPSRDEWVGWMCGLTGERRERSGSRARRLIMYVNL
jgi:hypothetical protein